MPGTHQHTQSPGSLLWLKGCSFLSIRSRCELGGRGDKNRERGEGNRKRKRETGKKERETEVNSQKMLEYQRTQTDAVNRDMRKRCDFVSIVPNLFLSSSFFFYSQKTLTHLMSPHSYCNVHTHPPHTHSCHGQ